MQNHDQQHENDVERTNNLEAMFEEMREAFGGGDDYYGITPAEVFVYTAAEAMYGILDHNYTRIMEAKKQEAYDAQRMD